MFNNQVLNDRQMAVRLDRANETLKLPEGLKGIGMGLGSNGEPLRDVARNLPSNNSASQSSAGSGILGAVPNNAFQVASALSGLNNVVGGASGLGGLANSSMLQAANLAGVGNLASSLGLNAADLQSLAASNLVSNTLVQNSSPFGALGNQSNLGNSNAQPFSRGDASYASNQNSFGGGQNQSFGSNSGGRGFQSAFESNKMSGVGGGNTGAVGGYGGGYGVGGGTGGVGQLLRSQAGSNIKDGGLSRKILISNLPASATFKMLSEKFNEFGDVQHLEEKGTGSMLVVYASDWQAERAIKNLDRARVDGRTIDARYFY